VSGFEVENMKRSGIGRSIMATFVIAFSGCGDSGSESGGAADQPKMSPEDVQKEIQKLSPPATKGKAKK
jgi:hypothetical protein